MRIPAFSTFSPSVLNPLHRQRVTSRPIFKVKQHENLWNLDDFIMMPVQIHSRQNQYFLNWIFLSSIVILSFWECILVAWVFYFIFLSIFYGNVFRNLINYVNFFLFPFFRNIKCARVAEGKEQVKTDFRFMDWKYLNWKCLTKNMHF